MAESQKNVCDTIVKPATLQSPIIMKIDGPSEDSKELDDNEKNACSLKSREEFKMCSPSFRSSSTSTSNPFASSQNKFARGILKPPQLSLNNSVIAPNKTFILKPSQLQLNPFGTKSSDNSDKNNSEKTDNGDKRKNQVNGEMPKFVPLIVPENKTLTSAPITSNQSSTTSSATVSNGSFIFGQNIQERVVAAEAKEEPKASSSLNSNSTSEMLFSNVIKHEIKTENSPKEKEAKSLSESAREYEESRANKRKYEEVEVITGEEHEDNILKISCKLFSFDKASGSWQERGRGILRLNDFEIDDAHMGSRLVFRTTGSLRVILNTKIWAEMTIDKASDKSIRLTALDATGEIKVFLIMTNIEDSHKLYSHLQTRLEREIVAQKRNKQETSSVEPDSGGN